MYRIKYNDLIIFDPYDTNSQVFDAKLSQKINSAAYLDFTISNEHPLYDTVKERDGVVSLSWIEESGEQEKLFEGVIDSISINFYGHKEISCISALDYLNDTVVRPYSTIAGEQDLTAPSSIEGYFDWLIEQHNNHILDSKKRFNIGINQGAGLRISDYIYRSSTDNPTTASEISNKILESLGGYLILDYGETSNTLNLYSDIHEMNTQIIDFGVNLLDFTKKTDTDKQYTAVIPIGGSPKLVDGGFEDDDSFWLSPDNLSVSADKVHSGNKSAYFVEGNGEFINKSFFYTKHNATYKSTVWIKNERTSKVKIYPSYQTSAGDSWENQTPNNVQPMDIPNDDQWHEYSFTFSPNIVDGMKIRPRWVFDPVSNDNGARVYVDDFNFSRVIGDNTIEEDPISIATLGDGVTEFDYDFVKHGDVIYSSSAVQRYGYKEKVFQDTTITDAQVLMQEAVRQLNMCLEPTINIDVKAIDLSLYMNGYSHLKIWQAVRIRSAIHKTDLYLIVSSIDINLQNPAQTSYELGEAYDTLSGKQSSYIQSLNSSINSSLDAVASLDQTTKDQAVKIGSVTEATKKAQETADSATTKADNAQTVADTAQQTANANKEQINTVKDKQSEHDALIEQAKQDIAASENEIGGINDRMTQMDSDIDKAQSDLETFRTETNTTVQNVRDSVSKTQSDVDAVTDKVNTLSSGLDTANTKITQTSDKLDGLTTTVSNVSSNADSALSLSTQNHQDLASFQTTVQQTYSTKEETLSQVSSVSQKADAISATLSKDYQKTADSDAKYSTKAELTAASNSITASVSETYATKSVVQALQNIADNAIETWQGHGAPSLTVEPAVDWNTPELKKQHSGDMYYDLDTGYSYRFVSEDGSTYSWSKISDSDITKAMQAAAAAQSSADTANSGVRKLNTDIPATYATKSEVQITTDGIKTDVIEAKTLGQTGIDNAATVDQKADGIQATVTQQAQSISDNVKAIAQVNMRADSISTSVTQVSNKTDLALANAENYIKNSQFHGSNLDSVRTTQMDASDSNAGTLPAAASTYGKNTGGYDCIADAVRIHAIAGHTYRIEIDSKPASDMPSTETEPFGLIYWLMAADNPGIISDQYTMINTTPTTVTDWTHSKMEFTYAGSEPWSVFRPAYRSRPSQKWLVTNFSCTDVTEVVSAQKAADDAQGTANSALSKATTLEQSLDGFKTTVVQTYETKNDSLSKQSTLNQKVDGLRSEVSETYATKTQLNNASSTTNMWPNQWFDTSKPLIGRDPVGDEIEAAPVGGNIRIIEQRDHYNDSVSSSVTPGRTYKVSVDAKKISGTKSTISGGIWYTVRSSGAPWDGAEDFTNVKNYGNGWYRFERTVTVPDGKTMGTAWLQHNENFYNSNPAKWKISNLRFEDVTDIADIQANYSTKSYVDQTSRTVSLGVVEEYKNGQHGSALATASDITAAKDSITSTVSQTYATKSALGDTNNNVSNAQNAANLALANSQNMVKNIGNDLANTWGNNGVTAENGVYTRTFPGNENHVDFLWGGLSGKAIPGHTYSISLDARVDSGNYVSGDMFNFGWTNDWAAVNAQGLSGNWQRFAVDTTVSGDGNNAPQFFMSSYMTSAGSKVVQFRNLSIKDITEVALLQSDVADTYATQSLVQQTSQQWGVQLTQLSTSTDNAISDVNNALNNQSDALTATSDKIDDEIAHRQAYMNFTQDDNGNPLLELGASQNTNKVAITNEKVAFQSEGSEVAYISNKELHINNATIVQKLIIGNQIGFIPRADGHLTLTRI